MMPAVMSTDADSDPQVLRALVLRKLGEASDEEVRRIHALLLEWEEQRRVAAEAGLRLSQFDLDAIEESIDRFRAEHPTP